MYTDLRFYGLLRVKNEERWIDLAIRSLEFCERVFVFDDHSTDATREIAEAAGADVLPSPFHGLDEVRDKDYLLEQAFKLAGPFGGCERDWGVMIDGDEEFEPAAGRLLRERIQINLDCAYTVRILYLWDSEQQIRVDGVYGRFTRPSIFPLSRPLPFRPTSFGGNFHCRSVPAAYIGGAKHSHVDVRHFGYMRRDDRLRKYHWYNEKDPDNEREDYYRHMIQGDIDEVRATDRLKHAGPLKFERKVWEPAVIQTA